MLSYYDRVSDSVAFPSKKSEQGGGRWNREFRQRLVDRSLILRPEISSDLHDKGPLRAPACFGEEDGWPWATVIAEAPGPSRGEPVTVDQRS